MITRCWFGAKLPKRARGNRLFRLLPAMFRSKATVRTRVAATPADGEHGGELGWTVGLSRGRGLPPLRLSMLARPGTRMALTFESCRVADLSSAREERC